MSQSALVLAAAVVVLLFVLTELAAAVLPVIILIAFVPAADRRATAELLLAVGRSPRFGLRQAVHVAVAARLRR